MSLCSAEMVGAEEGIDAGEGETAVGHTRTQGRRFCPGAVLRLHGPDPWPAHQKVDTGDIVTAVSFPVKDPAVLSGVDDIRWPGAVFSLQTRTNRTGVAAGPNSVPFVLKFDRDRNGFSTVFML